MKYLDREPRVGDRVQSQITGVVTGVFGDFVSVKGDDGYGRSYSPNHVRVIAPEPRVGDVVTADMDLPDGSIIEYNREQLMGATGYNIAVRRLERWRMTHTQGDIPALDGPGDWRIVRIGPAQ